MDCGIAGISSSIKLPLFSVRISWLDKAEIKLKKQKVKKNFFIVELHSLKFILANYRLMA